MYTQIYTHANIDPYTHIYSDMHIKTHIYTSRCTNMYIQRHIYV